MCHRLAVTRQSTRFWRLQLTSAQDDGIDNPGDPYRFPWPLVSEINFGQLLTPAERQQLLYANHHKPGQVGTQFTPLHRGKYTHTTAARTTDVRQEAYSRPPPPAPPPPPPPPAPCVTVFDSGITIIPPRAYRVAIEEVPTFPLTIELPDSALSHAAKRNAFPPTAPRDDTCTGTGADRSAPEGAQSQAASRQQEEQPVDEEPVPSSGNAGLQGSRVEGEELSPLAFDAIDTNGNGKISAHELSAAVAGSTGRWPYATKVEAGGAALALYAVEPALAVEMVIAGASAKAMLQVGRSSHPRAAFDAAMEANSGEGEQPWQPSPPPPSQRGESSVDEEGVSLHLWWYHGSAQPGGQRSIVTYVPPHSAAHAPNGMPAQVLTPFQSNVHRQNFGRQSDCGMLSDSENCTMNSH